ncbi:MAG: TIGR02300 family protein [Alphaproteobacteria bacterium]|nr:TIGR02300 family protein [Alphaproteobacteria bacterium]
MNKEKWGIKRVCLCCATRFYDLNKSPIFCPNCGEEFDPEYLMKKKSKLDQEKEVDEVIEDVELLDTDEDIESEENVSLNEAED